MCVCFILAQERDDLSMCACSVGLILRRERLVGMTVEEQADDVCVYVYTHLYVFDVCTYMHTFV